MALWYHCEGVQLVNLQVPGLVRVEEVKEELELMGAGALRE